MDKRQDKKDALKRRLIAVATDLVCEQGLQNLRARDIAEKAGVALGSLYTVFDDLDALILHVNSATLRQMETELRAALIAGDTPRESLRSLTRAYLLFALEKTSLWAALFEHRMPEGVAVPEWHLQEHAFLIGLIAAPLAALMPNVSEADIALRARTFFGAVHGVLTISLEARFIGISPERLEIELLALADILFLGQVALGESQNK
jgi:AcrR family transcriptional regulator